MLQPLQEQQIFFILLYITNYDFGARFVTETRHFHWGSVKLGYLIGRDTGHLLEMSTSPNFRSVTGLSERPHSDFELDRAIECVNGSVR
jgi:hypothetical protein